MTPKYNLAFLAKVKSKYLDTHGIRLIFPRSQRLFEVEIPIEIDTIIPFDEEGKTKQEKPSKAIKQS